MMFGFKDTDRARAVAALIEKRPIILVQPYRGNGLNLAQQLYTEYDAVAPLSEEERAEVEATYVKTRGLRCPNGRPFRAPHHTASVASLLGTYSTRYGRTAPTEWELAEHGVLVFDEVAELRVATIEAVAKRLDRGPCPSIIAIHTSCPCGRSSACRCPSEWTLRWHARIDPLVTRAEMFHLTEKS
jgi:magnesium chelatase family protein